MLKTRLFRTVLMPIATLGLATQAHANPIILFDNTAGAYGGSQGINSFSTSGASFTTNANPSTLAGIELELNSFSTGEIGTINVQIWNSVAGIPNSEVAAVGTIDMSTLSAAGPTLANVVITDAIALDSNTTYWVLPTSTAGFAWSHTNDTTGTGVASGFQYAPAYGVTANTSAGQNVVMQVSVNETTNVDEPASLALLAAGVIGIAMCKRRRAT